MAAPRYMWWTLGSGSYTVAGLPLALRTDGWVAFAEDVLIPRFNTFNDDDGAKAMIHMPFGRNRAESGDLELDCYLMRREEAEFPLVYNLDAFEEAMALFYAECGQYPELYFGTMHGTEYDKWHLTNPTGCRARVWASLEPLLRIPNGHRRFIGDTMGVFQPPSGRYVSGPTDEESRFGTLLATLREIGCESIGIEPRARLETGWENAGADINYWTTSQLMDSSNDTESGTGSGWCLDSAKCEGTFGILVTDARTESEIAAWLNDTHKAKAVAVGGLSDPGMTSSEMVGFVE